MRCSPIVLFALWSCDNGGEFRKVNNPPTVSFVQPVSGGSFEQGEAVDFLAVAEDDQTVNEELTYYLGSDIDGVIAEGTPDAAGDIFAASASLSLGTHAISVKVVDGDAESAVDSIAITIAALAQPPSIAWVRPIPGEYGIEGIDFEFSVVVSDLQDTANLLTIELESDHDGVFCEPIPDAAGAARCDADLSVGPHTLTATVMDVDGNFASEQVYYTVNSRSATDDDRDGYTEDDNDCDDTDISVHPGAEETCNRVDDDCDETVDEGTECYDDDGDGQTEASGDCDDGDPRSYTGAAEACDNLDNDCNGVIDNGTSCYDDDGDGYTDLAGDCDDTVAATWPGAPEIADGADNDCDGLIDEGTVGYDDDGDCFCETASCAGSASSACTTLATGDCNDGNASISPAASEFCNSIDDDCDGIADESDAVDALTWYTDADSDGYGDLAAPVFSCTAPVGAVSNSTDCDDSNDAVNPSEAEYCNTIDDDCNGAIDDITAVDVGVWFFDNDGDTYGDPTEFEYACEGRAGYVLDDEDCDDDDANIYPDAIEVCNGADDDCDGDVDEDDALDVAEWHLDGDRDGHGDPSGAIYTCAAPSNYVSDATDCDDTVGTVYPGAPEACNLVDDDCDGGVDEDVTALWYLDADGDLYGDASVSSDGCSAPSGYVGSSNDCDDTEVSINPGSTETCNGVDDDCDGTADEGVGTVYYLDSDGDTYGTSSVTAEACSAPPGYTDNDDDCNDSDATISPDTIWYRDADGDGYGGTTTTLGCSQPSSTTAVSSDCDDTRAAVNPAATEACGDSRDNDCDGAVDEENASSCTAYYYDGDGDSYGTSARASKCLCSGSGLYTALNNTDCYDSNSNANPGATTYYTVDRGDGSYDYNCDGTADKRYDNTYSCPLACLGTTTDGWSSSVPACAGSSTWRSGCSITFSGTFCTYSSSTSRTQSCR